MRIRILLAACCLLLVAISLATKPTVLVKAQETEKPKTSLVLKKGFEEVSTWITKSADMVPAEKYNYKPVDTVRSFGQIIGHVTDAYNYFCANGSGNKVQWADPAEKGVTDKATLIPKLKEATDKCNAVYGSDSSQLPPLMANIAHSNLHYGNLITYIRMMGLKPPSS